MGADEERQASFHSLPVPVPNFTFASSFAPGRWDAVVIPVKDWFSSPDIKEKLSVSTLIFLSGQPYQMRMAWQAGVYDFLREPWNPEELILRMGGFRPRYLTMDWGPWQLTFDGTLVCVTDLGTLQLPGTESEIFRVLLNRFGLPVSRSLLSWAAGCSNGRVVDTLISRLRGRLRKAFGPEFDRIHSVRGHGYRVS